MGKDGLQEAEICQHLQCNVTIKEIVEMRAQTLHDDPRNNQLINPAELMVRPRKLHQRQSDSCTKNIAHWCTALKLHQKESYTT